MTASALPVFEEALPAGVVFVKHYSGNGYDLVECTHATEHQRPTGGWVAFPPTGEVLAGQGKPVALTGEPFYFHRILSEREARDMMPSGWTLDYGGLLLCRVCKGDEMTTDSFRRPVQFLAHVGVGLRSEQAMLF